MLGKQCTAYYSSKPCSIHHFAQIKSHFLEVLIPPPPVALTQCDAIRTMVTSRMLKMVPINTRFCSGGTLGVRGWPGQAGGCRVQHKMQPPHTHHLSALNSWPSCLTYKALGFQACATIPSFSCECKCWPHGVVRFYVSIELNTWAGTGRHLTLVTVHKAEVEEE